MEKGSLVKAPPERGHEQEQKGNGITVKDRKNKRKRMLFHTAAALIMLLFLVGSREFLDRFPLPAACRFSSPTAVFPREKGGAYVIDNGKKEVLVLEDGFSYRRSLKGGGLKEDFYYASLICDDEEGNIYLSDVVYAGEGTRVGKERILAFDENGKNRRVLYERSYQKAEMPYQYGNILELKAENGQLSFLIREDGGVLQVALDTNGRLLEQTKWQLDKEVRDASYDAPRDRLLVGTGQGELFWIDQNEKEESRLWPLFKQEGAGRRLPWSVTVRNGEAVYADLFSHSLMLAEEGAGKAPKALQDAGTVFYTIETGADGSLYATDYGGIYCFKEGEGVYLSEVPLSHPLLRISSFGAAFILAAGLLVIFCRFLLRMTEKIRDKDKMLLIGMVLTASVLVGVTAGGLVLRAMVEQKETGTMKELNLFGDLMASLVDVQAIEQVRELKDYGSPAFWQVKEPLDEMIESSYENGIYYYYILYRNEEEALYGIMDYENTVHTGQPVYEWGDNAYTLAAAEGKPAQVYGDVSAYGTWSFVLKPIRNEKGEVCAVLETGLNMDDFLQEKNRLISEIVFTVGVSMIVIMMLLMEMIFLVSNWLRGRKQKRSITGYMPLRTIIFLIYMADSLQDAFIVQLCDRLCRQGAFLPREIMTALPISMELFMAALFALIGGRLVSRLGARKNFMAGLLLQAAGFLCCALFVTYEAILLGKLLVGAGMGITAVTANALAAMGETEEISGKAFAGINAGILGGITVGDGLGSVLLSLGSHRFVYGAGMVISLTACMLASAGQDAKPRAEAKEKGRLQTLAFLKDKRVWPFFLFILIPFMMMIYYREYFFPLYAQENGMSEIMIGRLFLLCGLVIIYAGPFLGEWLIGRMGSKRAMLTASIAQFINVALFMAFPSFPAAVLGAIGVSVIVSFAYTCQNAYFASLPVCQAYGEGNAMGMYSMMDNIGQTLGPVWFGFVISMGYTAGIRTAGAAFGILLLLYLIGNSYQRKKRKRMRRKAVMW